jgi:hypothetical protein
VLSIVANLGHVAWLLWPSIAVIGIGLIVHMVGLGIRVREAKRRLKR